MTRVTKLERPNVKIIELMSRTLITTNVLTDENKLDVHRDHQFSIFREIFLLGEDKPSDDNKHLIFSSKGSNNARHSITNFCLHWIPLITRSCIVPRSWHSSVVQAQDHC